MRQKHIFNIFQTYSIFKIVIFLNYRYLHIYPVSYLSSFIFIHIIKMNSNNINVILLLITQAYTFVNILITGIVGFIQQHCSW